MTRRPKTAVRGLVDDALWYKDAVIYELRVRSFADSNGDGVGDLPGLTQRLDYLQDLGVDALWLLPLCPSPGRDDGYDISDYTDVHPDIGTLDDFRRFLDEAHRRGIRVITELVLNHTSDQHPWFQRARRAPKGSPDRDFYVWSDTPERYREARIIFKDFEPSNWSWDPVAQQYFWHRFFAHQPDLNFDNPAVRDALLGVVDFWFGLGVDGLRLDAVPYLYERDGTSCENLDETHVFLRKLRQHVDSKWKNRMLLAEANQWPEDAAAYLRGDGCHMNFHFPIMPRLFMSIHAEDRLPIVDILAQTPQLPEVCQWALFLRNHDELTLEMVTEEERDTMYRAYAQDPTMRINLGIRRRLAPLVKNDRRVIELLNGLLFSMPGTPVLYYGDEIGMGDNVYLGDRNGVRTPMQWSADRNAGFSRANPQRLILPVIIDPQYHYETVNVEAQQDNPSSLLWWMKRMVALRKQFHAFGRGTIEFLSPENPRVLAFVREHEGECVLVVANLSRTVQYVELDLRRLKGRVPIELFGRTHFPTIGELPYLLTLGAHAFYWFSIEEPQAAADARREAEWQPRTVPAQPSLDAVLAQRDALQGVLLEWLPGRRWFDAKGELTAARIVDVLSLPGSIELRLVVVRAEFESEEPELYLVPLALAQGGEAGEVRLRAPQAALAVLPEGALVYDALGDPRSAPVLVEAMQKRVRTRGTSVALSGDAAGLPSPLPEARVLKVDTRATTLAFGDEAVLRIFRRVGEGVSGELEILRFLANKTAPVPRLLGTLEARAGRGEPVTLGTLQTYVRAEGSGWTYVRDELRRAFERALTIARETQPPPPPSEEPWSLAGHEPPDRVREVLGGFSAAAQLLGERLAELHAALASPDDPGFMPDPYSPFDQRSLYQSKRNLTGRVLRQLRGTRLAGEEAKLAQALLGAEPTLYRRFEPLLGKRLTAKRGRLHGHYHLSNVLWTGKDFAIIDFEGNHGRPLPERRRKRSPLRDVVAMIRSLDYAVYTALYDEGVVRPNDREALAPWAELWYAWGSAAFVCSYLNRAGESPFVPRDRAELALLLDTQLLEKALDELSYDLRERPSFAHVPLRRLCRVLKT